MSKMKIKQLLLIVLFLIGISNIAFSQVDTMEYATGRASAQQQLLNYPLPRFKEGHTLNRNFIWFGLNYFSGAQQSGVTNQQMINTAKVNNVEFYTNWNYYFMVNENMGSYGSAANYADTVNYLNGAMAAIAKRNPTWQTSAICFWAQIGGNINKTNLTAEHYMRNASGGYLNTEGASAGTAKYWSPVAPDASIIDDGQKQKTYLQNLINAIGRPLTILNENGEVIPLMSKNGGLLNNDPYVAANYSQLGYPSNRTQDTINDYRGRRYSEQTKLYRDQFMTVSPTTIFTHYGLDGQTDYRPVWTRSKSINSQIKGKYYATGDFYPRWPDNWRAWAGAWHGLGWFADCKYWEMKYGDSLMSPFVSAGWNIDETQNVRPAQYLACLKILSAWGSEFYYTGYFSLSSPWPNSMNWGWQTVMPVYAQAVSSYYEDFFRNGTLLTGDVPRYYLSSTTLWPNNPKYLFNTGDNRQFVAVRKLNGANKYVITTAQMVDANTIGNAPMVSYGKFKLGSDSIRVEFRRQGSVYLFDADSKTFYQLDKWHQYEHPERWSKDIALEAEVADAASGILKTTTIAPNDYVNSTTSRILSSTDTIVYNIGPRVSTTYYVWVRAKGLNTGFSVSVNNTTHTVNCVNSSDWKWYGFNSNDQQMTVSLMPNKNRITIKGISNTIEIDQVVFSLKSDYQSSARCNVIPVATITSLRPTTFCNGDSTILQANSGVSYLWSNGATTQNITTKTAGIYSVTVTTAAGVASSSPLTVTVNSLPVAELNYSGPRDICNGDSIALSGNAPNYNWNTGSTSRTIIVKTAGSYFYTAVNNCGMVTSPTISITTTDCNCAPVTNLTSKRKLFVSTQRTFSWTRSVSSVSKYVFVLTDLSTNKTRSWDLASTASSTVRGGLTAGRQYSWQIIVYCTSGSTVTVNGGVFIQ